MLKKLIEHGCIYSGVEEVEIGDRKVSWMMLTAEQAMMCYADYLLDNKLQDDQKDRLEGLMPLGQDLIPKLIEQVPGRRPPFRGTRQCGPFCGRQPVKG